MQISRPIRNKYLQRLWYKMMLLLDLDFDFFVISLCGSVSSQLNRITTVQGVGVEMFATFQLVLCVLAVTDKRRRDVGGSVPLAIGFSVALGHLTAVSTRYCTKLSNQLTYSITSRNKTKWITLYFISNQQKQLSLIF